MNRANVRWRSRLLKGKRVGWVNKGSAPLSQLGSGGWVHGCPAVCLWSSGAGKSMNAGWPLGAGPFLLTGETAQPAWAISKSRTSRREILMAEGGTTLPSKLNTRNAEAPSLWARITKVQSLSSRNHRWLLRHSVPLN